MSPEQTKEKLSTPAILTVVAIIIVGGLFLAKAKMPLARKNQAPATVEKTKVNVPPVTTADVSTGPTDAKVTLVLYSDSQCPYCRVLYPSIKQLVDQDKEVRWVYRHAPFKTTGRKEAEAMDCANDQGKFWEYLDAIYTSNDTENISDPVRLTKIAVGKGLSEQEFSQCLTSGKYAGKITEYLNAARDAKVQGTPFTLAIGSSRAEEVVGAVSFEQLKATVDGLK